MFSKKQTIILGVVVFFAVLSSAVAYGSISSGALQVHFFDVGQGDAIFIKTPNGNKILIDGGRDSRVIGKLANVLPFYDRSIDLVIATHMDADHIGGLLDVVSRFKISGIVVSDTSSNTELSDALWALIKEKNIPVMQVEAGDNFLLDKDVNMLVLSPSHDAPRSAKDNDKSVTVKLTYKNDSFLFTGDLERRGEYTLASAGIDITSDVLKVGHHGSNTSSTKYFLSKAAASLAVIQVGKNSYGHPHDAVLQRLSDTPLLRNDQNGDITLYSYGDSF